MTQGRGAGIQVIGSAGPTPRQKAADNGAWVETCVLVASWGVRDVT